jgi:ribosome-binding protein aMBF1 (putative translation factor)
VAQKESQSERQERVSLLSQVPADFAETVKKRLEECANSQTELFEQIQETNKQWFDRAQAEAKLASEFISKLSSARSIPDAMTAYQEWGARRFEMMAEDAKHALDNTQQFIKTSTHMLTNGFATKGHGIST